MSNLHHLLVKIQNEPSLEFDVRDYYKDSSFVKGQIPIETAKLMRELKAVRSPAFDKLRSLYVERHPLMFNWLPDDLITDDHIVKALPLGMVEVSSFPQRFRSDPGFMDMALAIRPSLATQLPPEYLTLKNFRCAAEQIGCFVNMGLYIFNHYPKTITSQYIDEKISKGEWIFGKVFPEEKFKPNGDGGLESLIKNAGAMQKYISENTDLKGKSAMQQRVGQRKLFLEYAARVIAKHPIEEVAACVRNTHQLEVAAKTYPLDDLIRMSKMSRAQRGIALENTLGF